jgi:hypothetical protein
LKKKLIIFCYKIIILMKYLYVNIGRDWTDSIIYMREDEAIQASLRNPNSRIEVFEKTFDLNGVFNGYMITHNYYKNRVLNIK